MLIESLFPGHYDFLASYEAKPSQNSPSSATDTKNLKEVGSRYNGFFEDYTMSKSAKESSILWKCERETALTTNSVSERASKIVEGMAVPKDIEFKLGCDASPKGVSSNSWLSAIWDG